MKGLLLYIVFKKSPKNNEQLFFESDVFV